MKNLAGGAADKKRIESIDLLRGLVMIVMALDHTRDYFHADAFVYSPTDLSRTSVPLFFTRWITHYCAPVFVFLAGVSACLYGSKAGRKELSFFLWTRGLWLLVVEVIILSFFKTFNPAFSYINLQVIWAIGICMIVLSGLVFLHRRVILLIGLLLVVGHNLLDGVHVPGEGLGAFIWSALHDPQNFSYGPFLITLKYPVLAWIGVIALGYYCGGWFTAGSDPSKRRLLLILLGVGAIELFVILRWIDGYGDSAHWSSQKDFIFTLMSFLNVTKYPPSLLYILITLGPALIFLAFAEKPLGWLGSRVATLGRVAMFYYLTHFLLLHILAVGGALLEGYGWKGMILTVPVNSSSTLKGYGFGLGTTYLVWISVVLILYPLCRWYDRYKRANVGRMKWLSYL